MKSKLLREIEKEVRIYTSFTGTEYDVDNFLGELSKYTGEQPFKTEINNERAYFSSLQKYARKNGYKIVWISMSLNKNVILDTLVNSPEYTVIGFGVSIVEEEKKLYERLEEVKSVIENTTDDQMMNTILNHYQNKAKMYGM